MRSNAFSYTFLRWLPWLIIILGFTLRLQQYLSDRSLWLDELFVAANFITDKPLAELLTPPLDYSHSYIVPIGFMLITKLLTHWFGNSELILRLFPLLSGLASLLLFYKVAKIYISPNAVPLALFLFAISDKLIYYTSEFKQYASDVAIALMLLWLLAYLRQNNTTTLTPKKLFLLTLIGITTPWFSHPSVFMLATIGSYLTFFYLFTERHLPSLIKLFGVYLLWLLSFIVMYTLTTNGGVESSPVGQWLTTFWKGQRAFMPSVLSKDGLIWIIHNYAAMFILPGSLGRSELAGWLFLLGCLTLFINKKSATTLLLLILPLFITAFASSFQLYPFSGRLLLFLTPMMYLIIAEGITHLRIDLSYHNNYPNIPRLLTLTTQMMLTLYLFNYYPITNQSILQSRTNQEIRPVIEYVHTHKQPNDIVYFYYWSEPALRYYGNTYGFNYNDCHLITPLTTDQVIKEIDYFRIKQNLQPVPINSTHCILGIHENFDRFKQDLDLLKSQQGSRVWFIFSHIDDGQRTTFLNYMNNISTHKDEYLQPGAMTYLYQY